MESEASILLTDAVAYLQHDGHDERLVQMLAQSRAAHLTDHKLTIEAPSRFASSYLERNKNLIEGYLEQIAFTPLTLVISEEGVIPPPTLPTPQSSPIRTPDQRQRVTHQTAQSQSPLLSVSNTNTGESHAEDELYDTPTNAHAGSVINARATLPVAPHQKSGFADQPEFERDQQERVKEPAIKVQNTLSHEDYLRMIKRVQESPAVEVTPTTSTKAPSVHINSKFTFDTFVYGDENKHAYHSSQRFAAFADEPGQCNSLFIYGGSGLGKTHLLLAIKNYLAEHKPHIRVKYANSQAYIDDFINEIARQKTENRAILRDYHDANVLIIDDIQNIIGKQASIEYFFSLMDEFIRENKKVVIASDRAPKKLGMDERLTSRFNAGMLCLVSEPGFEMKYTILKRYYETIILGGDKAAEMNVDASLLGAFQTHEGKLTDEQLRHMSEISGNNIRELESFCERCASLSFEREQSGTELTAEDIERVADEYFDTAHKIIHIDTIQAVVEEFYHISHEELIGPRRSRDIAFARHVAVYLANSLCDLSSKAIGEQFGGRDHSTVINSLKVVEKKIKEDRRICEDLQQLKNKITLRS
ncbi:ATP-binding protein [Collinsella sp. AGMB00827]|uniref:Chromosomal replication initiator protein DnaA n=1 Tax=Collinsella ureilytica TaxID=2869515 RepID=A0ABS7ML31_9ACTN|nr:DnaA/Hda family protein [Collinsella urealyticum]MBY4797800.1 ATP-binding protein [Collinsella urealyticum]